MYDSDKWWIMSLGLAAVALATVISLNILSSYSVDRLAIKAGLVQKVDQARTIWVKP